MKKTTRQLFTFALMTFCALVLTASSCEKKAEEVTDTAGEAMESAAEVVEETAESAANAAEEGMEAMGEMVEEGEAALEGAMEEGQEALEEGVEAMSGDESDEEGDDVH